MLSGQAGSNVQNSSTPVTRDVENEHHSTLAVSGDGESHVSLPGCTPQVGCEA